MCEIALADITLPMFSTALLAEVPALSFPAAPNWPGSQHRLAHISLTKVKHSNDFIFVTKAELQAIILRACNTLGVWENFVVAKFTAVLQFSLCIFQQWTMRLHLAVLHSMFDGGTVAAKSTLYSMFESSVSMWTLLCSFLCSKKDRAHLSGEVEDSFHHYTANG